MKIRIIAIVLLLVLLLTGCSQLATQNGADTNSDTTNTNNTDGTQDEGDGDESDTGNESGESETDNNGDNTSNSGNTSDNSGSEEQGDVADLGDDSSTFGESIEDTSAYDGYFEGESKDFTIECLSGTENAYKLDGDTLTFTSVASESVYAISGTFSGNIVIDVGDEYKFDLELHGFSLVCSTTNPILVLSGDEVAIKAKKDTKNYIYDKRGAIDSTDETLYSGAIHSEVDLEIAGKGKLTVVSENNNGIHSKDDLQVKNLTLFVVCIDNSLKGNDGVEISNGELTLIASGGDCIKTSNSDVSSKGNQRGTITISGGTHTLYAACDGIDAAYDVLVDSDTTVLNIYTDKYSNYSKEVVANSSDTNYIRFTSNKYYYSVKYYNSDTDYVWVNAEYHSSVSGGWTTYYYYSYPKMPDYAKQQFFIYDSADKQGQEDDCLTKSDYLTPNSGSDTFALTQSNNRLSYQWTNYTTNIRSGGWGGGPGGFGGMGDGNTDKGDHSTKGIKAANEIVINAGTISIKSYDDAIHANNDTTLENGATPLGNVTVNGGNITVYSNDDGVHADGTLHIKAGTLSVINAYEGLEGTFVKMSGGYVSVNSKDDGINATTSTGTAIEISGGTLYIYCTGDGVDSNSKASYSGIVFSGGNTVVISNSSMNSAIDSEQGYAYTGGSVVAIMPQGGMSSESKHCQNFASIGTTKQSSLSKGQYLVVGIGDATVSIEMPVSLSSLIIVLGDNAATVTTSSSSSAQLDSNGVSWD